MKLDLTFDEILTTTRAVRKRLDTTRPVPRAVLEECLDLALQAPNGSNRNDWRWIIVDDPAMVKKLADEYRAAMGVLHSGAVPSPRYLAGDTPREDKLLESAFALVEKLDAMPAILIPLMPGRPDGKSVVEQASMWGSIVQAVWSFMLALRSRGLGSLWATVTSRREKEIAELLAFLTTSIRRSASSPWPTRSAPISSGPGGNRFRKCSPTTDFDETSQRFPANGQESYTLHEGESDHAEQDA